MRCSTAWVFLGLGLAAFLWMLNLLAITPFLYFIANDLETSVALLGQVHALVALATVPLGLIVGSFADRVGHRSVLSVGMFSLVMNSLLIALSPNYFMLFIAAFFGSISQTTILAISIAVAGRHFVGDVRRRAYSVSTAGLSIAGIAGIPALTSIGQLFDWRMAILALSIANAVLGLVVIFATPHTSSRNKAIVSNPVGMKAYSLLFTHRPTLGIHVSSLFRYIAIWFFYTYRGAFFVEEYNFNAQQVGWVFTIAGLGILIGSVLIGSRLGRFPLRLILVVGTLAASIAAGIILTLNVNVGMALLLVALVSMGLGSTIVATTTLLMDESPLGEASTSMVNQSATNSGAAIGSSLGGLLLSVGHYDALGYGVLVSGAAAVLAVCVSRPNRRDD